MLSKSLLLIIMFYSWCALALAVEQQNVLDEYMKNRIVGSSASEQIVSQFHEDAVSRLNKIEAAIKAENPFVEQAIHQLGIQLAQRDKQLSDLVGLDLNVYADPDWRELERAEAITYCCALQTRPRLQLDYLNRNPPAK